MIWWLNGNAFVCKTNVSRFDSDPNLFQKSLDNARQKLYNSNIFETNKILLKNIFKKLLKGT